MRCSRRVDKDVPGFTLSELLVVLGVIALLLAILGPAYGRVMASARSTMCKSNLKEIGKVYAMIIAEGELASNARALSSYGWAKRFREDYLGGNGDVLHCPATGHDDGLSHGDYDASSENPWGVTSLPDVKIRVYNGSTQLYDLDTFTSYPYWLDGSHADFDRRPGLWKVTPETYENIDLAHLPRYVPGSNPTEYWYLIEDQRTGTGSNDAAGDSDFNDFDLHVKELGAAKVELTGYHRNAGYHFGLVDEEGTEYPQINRQIGPIVLQGVWGLSYGMNTQVGDLQRIGASNRAIVVVDYRAESVGTGLWVGTNEGWEALRAPRHLGKLNALHADGGVEAYEADEVDPEVSTGAPYWSPIR